MSFSVSYMPQVYMIGFHVAECSSPLTAAGFICLQFYICGIGNRFYDFQFDVPMHFLVTVSFCYTHPPTK